jgi:hypothetical protein
MKTKTKIKNLFYKKIFFVLFEGFHEREPTNDDLQKIQKHFMTAYVRYQSTLFTNVFLMIKYSSAVSRVRENIYGATKLKSYEKFHLSHSHRFIQNKKGQ